jgi:hypothetical protein
MDNIEQSLRDIIAQAEKALIEVNKIKIQQWRERNAKSNNLPDAQSS